MRFNKIYVGNARCSIPNRRGTRTVKGNSYVIRIQYLPAIAERSMARPVFNLPSLGMRIVIANTKSKISRYIRE